MTTKLVISSLTCAGLVALLFYAEPRIACVLMGLAKFAGHVLL